MTRFALLAGLFGVPAVLLWIGHRLGDRSPVERGIFWGGVTGHTIGLLAALTALHYPPVIWSGDLRITIAFWFMLLCSVLGAVVGAFRTRTS
jgi:hypothetical protein